MSKINAILYLTASFRPDLLFKQYSNNKGFDNIYCLNDEKRFVSNLTVRLSQSAPADGSHRPCRHPHLQFLSKLGNPDLHPKIHGTPSVTTKSPSPPPSVKAKTSLKPLEKHLFSFCSFQIFSKQKLQVYTITAIIPTVKEASQI
jgi:hypothetical protein